MAPPTRREQLQQMLETILGSRNVYFQPKDGLRMEYPAIVYQLESVMVEHGSNIPYKIHDRYQLTYIDRSPISPIPRELQSLPMCRFTSYFVRDGLNHYNHTIYF